MHLCTDQPFTLSAPSAVTVFQGQSIPLGPILLNDRDSNTSIFQAQLFAFCGYFTVSNMGNMVGVAGYGSYGQNIHFEGLYGYVRTALLNISYTASSSCGMRLQPEAITILVVNLENLSQNISMTIQVDILHITKPPEIVHEDFPSWIFHGINLRRTADFQSSVFQYLQMRSGYSTEITISSNLDITSRGNVMSDLAVLRGEFDTYVLGYQYGNETISLLSNSYIPLHRAFAIEVSIIDSFSSIKRLITTKFTCKLDDGIFPCEVSSDLSKVTCSINSSADPINGRDFRSILTPSSADALGDISWLQIIADDKEGSMGAIIPMVLSNFIPLYPRLPPRIHN